MENFNELDEKNRFDSQDTFENKTPPKKTNPVRTQLLTVIQLVLCFLIITAAIVIKIIGGTLYAEVGTWFFDNYNNSVFTGTADSFISFTDDTSISETSRYSADEITENSKIQNGDTKL